MIEIIQFAAASWWNLFVSLLFWCIAGGVLVSIAESIGKGFSKGWIAKAAIEEFAFKLEQEKNIKEARERFESAGKGER